LGLLFYFDGVNSYSVAAKNQGGGIVISPFPDEVSFGA